MPLSLDKTAKLHGDSCIFPEGVSDNSHTLHSISWNSTAFGMKVKIACKDCNYIESLTMLLDPKTGTWRHDGNHRKNHSKYCKMLRERSITYEYTPNRNKEKYQDHPDPDYSRALSASEIVAKTQPSIIDVNSDPLLNMSEGLARLHSFESENWVNHPASKQHDMVKLAASYLFYRGESDHVECCLCGNSYINWSESNYFNSYQKQPAFPCPLLPLPGKTPELWETARQCLQTNKPDRFKACINNESNESTKGEQLTKLLKWTIEEGKMQFTESILNVSECAFDSVTVDNQEMGLIIFAIINMQSGILNLLLHSEKILTDTDANRYLKIAGESWPRLCLTIKHDRPDMTTMLLQQGDDPTLSELITTPKGNRNINHQTDDPGAQPQGRENAINWTTWEYCLYSGKLDAFKLLIDNKLNITTQLATGEQPIHIAAKVNSIDALVFLRSKGVDLNTQTPLEEKDQKNTAPLSDSTEEEHTSCCPGLLRNRSKDKHRDEDPYLTIYKPGISHDRSNLDNYKIGFKFVAAGPSTRSNFVSFSFNNSNQKKKTETPAPLSTPLHFAARYRAIRAYQWLTLHKVNTELQDRSGYTAFSYLATNTQNFGGGVKQPNYFTT